jgi:hypothetical protein
MKNLATKLFVVLVFGVLFFSASKSFSQSMYFCEDVDKNGNPISSSSTFNIGKSGGYLDVLVKLPYAVGTYAVRYDVYSVDYYGSEKFENSFVQDVQPDWAWFWKQVTFYDNKTYNVYAYDSNNNFLASGQVGIKFK